MSFDSRTSGVEQQLFATSVQGNILKIMLLSVLLLMLVFAQRFENNDVSLFVKKSQKHKTTMDYHTGGGTLFIPYWLLRNVTAGILKSSVQYSFFCAIHYSYANFAMDGDVGDLDCMVPRKAPRTSKQYGYGKYSLPEAGTCWVWKRSSKGMYSRFSVRDLSANREVCIVHFETAVKAASTVRG